MTKKKSKKVEKKLNLPKVVQKIKTKKTKTSKKTALFPSIASKKTKSALAYYNCLIDKVANSPAKITQLAHQCKCTKKEIAQAQVEHKQQLVKEVAKNYKAFGQSLGHYLQADIIGCLEKK